MNSVNTNLVSEIRSLKDASTASDLAILSAKLAQVANANEAERIGFLMREDAFLERMKNELGFKPCRLALLSTSNFDHLAPMLRVSCGKAAISAEVYASGYGEWRQEMLAPDSPLATFKPQLTVLTLDDAWVFGAELEAKAALHRTYEAMAELTMTIEPFLARQSGQLIIQLPALSPLRVNALIDYKTKAQLLAAWRRLQAQITDLAAQHQGVLIVDAEQVALAASVGLWAPSRIQHYASIVYSREYAWAFAAELTKVVRAVSGLTKKALILDLDNTLWGGIIGDDGVDGIKVGGLYPGNAHKQLQIACQALKAQGIVLAVCSKNDHANAILPFTEHPEMVLKQSDFVAFKANWDSKARNIEMIANELNLGIDSLVFLDDNPVERDLVRSLCPTVAVPDVGEEISRFLPELLQQGYFNTIALTEEDTTRSEKYQQEKAREVYRTRAGNLTDYLRGLDIRAFVTPLNAGNSQRTEQMFARTNQFNLTTTRYTRAELEALGASKNYMVLACGVKDRFGDNGLIAALVVEKTKDRWTIRNFVLSCRVFSRNVEHALVALLAQRAAAAGVRTLAGEFVPSKKNGNFAAFYQSLGFTTESQTATATTWIHPLTTLPQIPEWIHIEEIGDSL